MWQLRGGTRCGRCGGECRRVVCGLVWRSGEADISAKLSENSLFPCAPSPPSPPFPPLQMEGQEGFSSEQLADLGTLTPAGRDAHLSDLEEEAGASAGIAASSTGDATGDARFQIVRLRCAWAQA